jgi:hypothetical protein
MSFEDLFGEGIPEPELRAAFKNAAVPESDELWKLGDCTIFLQRNDSGNVEHFNVERPTDDTRLWEGMFTVLQRGDAILYFPSDPLFPVVADARAVDLMPEDMRESFSKPHLVRSAEELIDSLDHEPG